MTVKIPAGRRRSVRTTLFSSYVLLVLLSTAFVTVFSWFYTTNMLRRLAFNSLGDISSKVVDALDTELSKMNAVSLAIASSDLVKQLVKERAAIGRSDSGSAQRLNSYRNAVQVVEVMQTIIGPYKLVPQVNLYDLRGGMIGAGAYSQAAQQSVLTVPWLDAIDLRSGAKRFSLPHDDPLLGKTFPAYSGRACISLYRTIYDEYLTALGVLEVEQFTATLFRGASSTSSTVAVFDPAGTRLFPPEPGRGRSRSNGCARPTTVSSSRCGTRGRGAARSQPSPRARSPAGGWWSPASSGSSPGRCATSPRSSFSSVSCSLPPPSSLPPACPPGSPFPCGGSTMPSSVSTGTVSLARRPPAPVRPQRAGRA